MAWIDAELALTALAAMLSPTTLSFSIFALVLGDRPLRTGFWFYLGAMTATLAIGVVAAFVIGDAAASDTSTPKTWVAIIDLVAGLMLGKAVTAALFAREKIGVGQRIDTSLLEAEVASLINVGSNYLVGGKVPTRWGNAHPNIVPYQNFKTADGYLVIGVASEVIWKRFCQAIGRPNLTDDARFANNSLRVENRTKLIALLSEVFLQRDNETWFKLLTAAEVPCSPVQTIDQVFQAPQVLHRDMVMEIEHPTAGKVRMAGIPVKFSVTPASLRLPPPLLGEHNEAILSNWLGMSAEAIDELKKEKII